MALIENVKNAVPNANLTFIECDLTSLASVKVAAQKVNSQRLDILICNAGIMAVPPGLTKDGFEVQFGTNHLGHAMLIKQLLPVLLHTAEQRGSDVRVVLLTSLGIRMHPKGGILFQNLKTTQDVGAFGPWIRYGQSKLANILYAKELARQYPNITTVSVHPGTVETSLVGNLGFANKALVYVGNMGKLVTPAQGAFNEVWAATCNKEKTKLVNGAFYEPVGLLSSKHDKMSQSDTLAGELWDWTEKTLDGF